MSETRVSGNSPPAASASSALQLITQAAQDGAADACDAAARTWAATGRLFARFVYNACYTVSYGVVFPAALLAQAVPRNNAAVRGLIDGAQAAILKADQLRSPALEPPAATAAPALASP